eukprot:GEMP01014966.1.p1 GENE.GEMP01014966.1~~GEMP01014966.1.p1  ORF type:complete len:661 (+),score=139.11 GEMP01014966.1:221-2203(+)
MAPAEVVASTAAGVEHQVSNGSDREDSSPERDERKAPLLGGEDAVLEGGRHRTVRDLVERIMVGTPRPRERTKHPSLPSLPAPACKASVRLLVKLLDGLSRDHEPRVCVTSKVWRVLTMEEKRAYIMGVGDALCALSRGELRPITSMRVADNAVRKPEKVIQRLVDAVKSMTSILDEAKSTEKTEADGTVPKLNIPEYPDVDHEEPEHRSARSSRGAQTPRSTDNTSQRAPKHTIIECDERTPMPGAGAVLPSEHMEAARDGGHETEISESESVMDNGKYQRRGSYGPEVLEEDLYEDDDRASVDPSDIDSPKRKPAKRRDQSSQYRKHRVVMKKKEELHGLWKFGNELAWKQNSFSDLEEGKQRALLRRAARHTRDDVHFMSNDDLHELRIQHCGHIRDALRAKMKDKQPEPATSVSLPVLPGVTAVEQVRKLQFILRPEIKKIKSQLSGQFLMDFKAGFGDLKKKRGIEEVPDSAFNFARFAENNFAGDLRSLFRVIDQNDNKRLSMCEFLQALSVLKFMDHTDPATSSEACRRLFCFLDSSKSGVIDIPDFMKLGDVQKAIAEHKEGLAQVGRQPDKFDNDTMDLLKSHYHRVKEHTSPGSSFICQTEHEVKMDSKRTKKRGSAHSVEPLTSLVRVAQATPNVHSSAKKTAKIQDNC